MGLSKFCVNWRACGCGFCRFPWLIPFGLVGSLHSASVSGTIFQSSACCFQKLPGSSFLLRFAIGRYFYHFCAVWCVLWIEIVSVGALGFASMMLSDVGCVLLRHFVLFLCCVR